MSDENIHISVDDAAIDDAIAKLEAALEKQQQLAEGKTPEPEQPYIMSPEETAQITLREQPYIIGVDEMELIEKAEAAKQHVDDIISESELQLVELNAEAEAVKTAVAEAVSEAEDDLTEAQIKMATAKLMVEDEVGGIKGLETSANRIIRMVPGLREASRLQRSLSLLQTGNIAGVLGVIMLAYSLYRQISAMMEEQKKQQMEYRRDVMEARGFTLTSEFDRWKEEQRQLSEQYRLTSIGMR